METTARARIYALFSRLFVLEVDDAFADVLRGEQARALLPGFAASPELDALASPERRVATFDADFAHLTVVNLVPYESFYWREDGLIESGGVNPVARFLGKYGFETDLQAARSLAPDHLGIELEVMALLCSREQTATDADEVAQLRRVEREFLREHLLAWAPVYLLAVRRTARTALYRDGADAALHFLHADLEELAR